MSELFYDGVLASCIRFLRRVGYVARVAWGQGSSCPAAPQKTTREIGRMAEAPERYCSNCGQELHPEDRFCSNCGRPVHLTARVPTPEADVPIPPPLQARRSAPPPPPAGAVSAQSNGRPDERSGQAPFSIKEMATLGVGAGVFTLLTSSWVGAEKLPGKLFFAILAPMMVAVIRSIIKAYLSGAGVDGRRLGILGILTALWRFGALPWETKKSILLATLRGTARVAVVLSIISVSTVVGIQAIINTASPTAPSRAPAPAALPASPTAPSRAPAPVTLPASPTAPPSTSTSTASPTAPSTASP